MPFHLKIYSRHRFYFSFLLLLQVSQAQIDADAVLLRAHEEARRSLEELAEQRAAIQSAEVALRRRESTLEAALVEAGAATDAAHAETRRIQEGRDILSERNHSVVMSREEVISPKNSKLLQRRQSGIVQVTHQKVPHLSQQAKNGVAVNGNPLFENARNNSLFDVSKSNASSPESGTIPAAPVTIGPSAMPLRPLSASSDIRRPFSAPHNSLQSLQETATKGSSRLERLESIVGAISHSGTADGLALQSAQHNVGALREELDAVLAALTDLKEQSEVASSGGEFPINLQSALEKQREDLSRWEAALGRALEGVVGMQRAALARSPPALGVRTGPSFR